MLSEDDFCLLPFMCLITSTDAYKYDNVTNVYKDNVYLLNSKIRIILL